MSYAGGRWGYRNNMHDVNQGKDANNIQKKNMNLETPHVAYACGDMVCHPQKSPRASLT